MLSLFSIKLDCLPIVLGCWPVQGDWMTVKRNGTK